MSQHTITDRERHLLHLLQFREILLDQRDDVCPVNVLLFQTNEWSVSHTKIVHDILRENCLKKVGH